MSHFGELSITSMYLLDFTSDHSLLERTQAFAGIFLGNLIPSSLMPAGFDIKRMLSYQTDVSWGRLGSPFGFLLWQVILV